MDSTVIQEIASQLGMAVDQAGAFIQDQLPAFAALKVMQNSVPIIIGSSLFAVAAVISLAGLFNAILKAKKELHRYEKDRKIAEESEKYIYVSSIDYKIQLDDYKGYDVFISSGAAALFLLFILFFVAIACVPDIIGWQNYPEAMLIDMALKAV